MIKASHYDEQHNLYHVPCLQGVPHRPADVFPVTVSVPGSKSITNRALLLATLAQGRSVLRGVLFSDDSRHFLQCVQDLGFVTDVNEAGETVTVTGCGGSVPAREASIYVGSAGTAARFLTAYLGVSHGTYHLDASEQMRRRPMAPLLASLRALGCSIQCETDREGFFPFTIESSGFARDEITVNIDHSSQFLSALLIASTLADRDFTVQVEGTHGMAYIAMTCQMMEQFGVQVSRPSAQTFLTKGGQHYTPLDYRIEPDVSAACYFYAWAPLLGVPVQVSHVHFDSLQGDVAFLRILAQMGCSVDDAPEGIVVRPPANGFHGVTADMSACSDQAITLAAIAPFADTPTTITGIGHIRFQESDRIHAIMTELGKMGIRCDETSGGSITIYPGTPAPCTVDTYDDHRMAMGFSLIGLRVPDIVIRDPGCCRKTFEQYFEVLEETIVKYFEI